MQGQSVGALKKHEYEAFCLAFVAGRDVISAYRSAYPHSRAGDEAARTSGQRLLRHPLVDSRIHELKNAVAEVVVTQVGLNEAAVVNELARIAFSDITKVCHWQNEVRETIDENDDGSVITVTRTLTPRVVLVADAEMDADTKAAIASVSLTSNGTLNIKMHSKVEALKVLEERFRPKQNAGDTINNNNVTAFIDAPPRETYEQWAERRSRMASIEDQRQRPGDDREMGPARGPTVRRDPRDVG